MRAARLLYDLLADNLQHVHLCSQDLLCKADEDEEACLLKYVRMDALAGSPALGTYQSH